MSKLAIERGTTQSVKDAATTMLTDRTKVNPVVHGLADKFGVSLPDRPKGIGQTGMGEIIGEQGQSNGVCTRSRSNSPSTRHGVVTSAGTTTCSASVTV